MKISFKTNSGYTLTSVDLLVFVICLGVLFTCISFFMTGAVEFENHITKKFSNLENKDDFEGILINGAYIFTGIIALVSFFLSFGRLIRGIFSYLIFFYNLNFFSKSRSIHTKIRDEIKSYPNVSQEKFERELSLAKKTESMISEAKGRGIITNAEIWKINWPTEFHEAIRIGDIIYPPLDETEKIASYHKEVDTLKDLLSNLDDGCEPYLEFIFSPVQPSIMKIVNRIKKELECNNIRITDTSTTGPESVKNAYEKKISSNKKKLEKTVIFIAPLSAFLTFESTVEGISPSDLFTPICSVIKEKQNILVVEDETSANIAPRTAYFFDNSTAEEFVALHTPLELFGFKHFESIDDIDKYKDLLSGNNNILNSGDAIITWPPLTNYYNGRSAKGSSSINGSAHFKKNMDLESTSQIFIFSDNDSFSNSTTQHAQLAWSFIRCINKLFLVLQQEDKNIFPDLLSSVEKYKSINKKGPFFQSLFE